MEKIFITRLKIVRVINVLKFQGETPLALDVINQINNELLAEGLSPINFNNGYTKIQVLQKKANDLKWVLNSNYGLFP